MRKEDKRGGGGGVYFSQQEQLVVLRGAAGDRRVRNRKCFYVRRMRLSSLPTTTVSLEGRMSAGVSIHAIPLQRKTSGCSNLVERP